MSLTLDTPVMSRGSLRPGQFVEAVWDKSNRTQYTRKQVQSIAAWVVYYSEIFGVNHDIVFAQIAHETDWLRFTGDVKFGQHNFAGLGATGGVPGHSFPLEGGLITDGIEAGVLAVVAHHAVYRWGSKFNWPVQLQHYASNDVDPRYQAALNSGNAGKMIMLGDYRGTWAVPGHTYPESIITRYLQITMYDGDGEYVGKPIIALAAGHKNTTGGGTTGESQRTGPLTFEIAKQLREHGGFDVRVITPDDGFGIFPGGLSAVGAEAVRLGADFFLEVHFEGVGNSSVRGCFAIYPDWTGDFDVDVRDVVGRQMASRVSHHTGIPLRGNGVMSERATGVGAGGHRLGVFGATASAKATMTRTIFEFGTLTNAQDAAIINGPGFYEKAAKGVVEALEQFYGVESVPEPAPYERYFPETGYTIVWGFKGFWENLEQQNLAFQILGYPKSEEFKAYVSGTERTVQIFERGVLGWYPERAGTPWEFRVLTLPEQDYVLEEWWSAVDDARKQKVLL